MSMIGTAKTGDIITADEFNKIHERYAQIYIELKSGSSAYLTFQEYMEFILYHDMLPSECKDMDELKEKLMVLRL